VNKPDFCMLSSNVLSIFSHHIRIFHSGYVICLIYMSLLLVYEIKHPPKFMKLMKHSDRISIIKVK
jgi:hypothetical protein